MDSLKSLGLNTDRRDRLNGGFGFNITPVTLCATTRQLNETFPLTLAPTIHRQRSRPPIFRRARAPFQFSARIRPPADRAKPAGDPQRDFSTGELFEALSIADSRARDNRSESRARQGAIRGSRSRAERASRSRQRGFVVYGRDDGESFPRSRTFARASGRARALRRASAKIAAAH